MAHPGGRPTKYSPEVIDDLYAYLEEAVPENMSIPSIEGFAIRLAVSKQTLYNWAEKFPEFMDALGTIEQYQKEHLIRIGIFGGKEINASIVALMLRANHNMIETSRQEVTGRDGEALVIVKKDGSTSK